MDLLDQPGVNDDGVIAVLNEHPEVRTLWERSSGLEVEIGGVNPIAHVLFEGIVENQLRELPEAGQTLERLMARGLCRHAARGVIVALFVKHYYYAMRDRESFPVETYLRQMALLGEQGVGRNQPCPCGSGRKFKACCAEFMDARITIDAGRLALGYGAYIQPGLRDPLDPLIRLENRVHIARFLDSSGDPEGARLVLKENMADAEDFPRIYRLMAALVDLILYCRHRPEFRKEEIEASDRLILLTGADGLDRDGVARLLQDESLGVLRCVGVNDGVVKAELFLQFQDVTGQPKR